MKFVFTFFLLIHGIIHLLGFAESYYFTDVNKQVLGIPKPVGAIWLLVFIMFMATALAFITNKKWFYIGFITVIISQILILLEWEDAKFGTIANIIILVVSISAFGNYQFNKMITNETKVILQHVNTKNTPVISEKNILHLPEIVQKWMRNSGVISKEKIVSVSLKQKGKMKIKPKSKWLSFRAIQYFTVETPFFLWHTEVDLMPMLKIIGRDKLINGKGSILIKLAGIIPIVEKGNNEKINSASLIRYLAEIIWFPSAALNNYIHWKTIDKYTTKATLIINKKSVSGIFKFSEHGEVLSFEAQRYYGAEKNSTLETWYIKTEEHKDFNGYKIPSKSKVTWKLKEGYFNWLNFEITELDYNNLQELKI